MPNSSGLCQQASPAPDNPEEKQQTNKKKRKRNKNKNKTPYAVAASTTSVGNPPKVENLISKTFLEKVGGAINASQSSAEATVAKLSEPDSMKQQTIAATKDKTMDPVSKSRQENEKMKITNTLPSATNPGKTREQIMSEREAKKLAKQSKKKSSNATEEKANENPLPSTSEEKLTTSATHSTHPTGQEKSREEVMSQREAKKLAKQAAKEKSKAKEQLPEPTPVSNTNEAQIAESAAPTITEQKKKPVLTKAERRAIQEAQRAAKANATQKPAPAPTPTAAAALQKPAQADEKEPREALLLPQQKKSPSTNSATTNRKPAECKVKLFNHLESFHQNANLFVNDSQIHPAIVRLGEQYAKRTIVGSNARCIAFLGALKSIIKDFQTPPKKEFTRSLESSIKQSVDHLQKCRLLAVSVSNAYKHIKHVLTQLPTDKLESELKENLCHFIDTYIENQIDKAAQAISISVQEKISNDDVILTYGCSSLINYIFEEAQRRHVNFRVIIVDSRPFLEGQELLRRLTSKEIPCTYVLINAISFVMPEVTKILLGAHALLSNGYVMARTGTSQVALVARSFNVPVLVCCETHKFCERFQTDAIVYNELGNPDDLIVSNKCCLTNWRSYNKLLPLNLNYDITPPELVTAVVTEVSILPCTSVPVILRIKPTEIGYNN